MTNANWFEVINEEGEWLKFESLEEAKNAYDELIEEGENVP